MMLQTEIYTNMTNEWRDSGFESPRAKNPWRGGNALYSILVRTDNRNWDYPLGIQISVIAVLFTTITYIHMFWCPSKPNLFSQTVMDKISKVIFINKVVLRFLLYVIWCYRQRQTYTNMTNEWRDRGFESHRAKTL